MYTFKITFNLFGGKMKTYTVKSGNQEDAIQKAIEKAHKARLDATGNISIYRIGSIQEPFTLRVCI